MSSMSVRTKSTESPEMYLKSIYQLGRGNAPVPISTLADHLGISPVSATEMIHRMVKRKLVEHIPYKGVYLTARGMKQALAVLRRHRLWERFLTDRLGLPWEKVHDVACQLEHSVGPEVTERLAEDLGDPSTCPHGSPIPSAEGEMPHEERTGLHELTPGQRAKVDVIQPETSEILEYFASRGIIPGAAFELIEIGPLDGPRTIIVEGNQVAISKELAECIMVQMTPEA
jgi:DtxR family Mn-dependent transcriptional regulator